ncbi:MAG: diguanylate cyclase [Acidobacteriota bacterium]|nr:diguanylate cyclase [Acidobacteriota bacterium]
MASPQRPPKSASRRPLTWAAGALAFAALGLASPLILPVGPMGSVAAGLAGMLALGLVVRERTAHRAELQAARQEARELSVLHMSAIEALALAIDAKDQTSHAHIGRLQLYAAHLATEMGMPEPEVQGVRTAALLHDIGKLAVPEHILSKPGPLSPDEFEKIRAHPKIGAEIIARVPFPYPVAPLILSHHERWDGKGYPAGLAGEAIPLGARVLSVVDYFDALTTDRPYHRAMPRDAALDLLRQESGRALDPGIVALFLARLPQLEAEARDRDLLPSPAGPDATATAAPEASDAARAHAVLKEISLAHREIYALYEIAQALGSQLGVADTMSIISSKLTNIVPFTASALFLLDEGGETLSCRYAIGTDADLLMRAKVKVGEGLSGWVARNRRCLVNARPEADLEAGALTAPLALKSALVCPLIYHDHFIGTLAVYHTEPGFYREDHRRLLDRVAEQGAAVIHNSILFEQTQSDSLTDPLTELPNTRFLFMHLAREIARASRHGTQVSLLIADLDGFKEINDTLGHHIGDRALAEVARVLRSAIRPYDICARYAGDEFVLVLSGCHAEDAERKRLELQQAVDAMRFEGGGRLLPLGISVGCAVFPDDGQSHETLLAVADSRMYRNKTGRKHQAASAPRAVDADPFVDIA